jgi:hypothetical protein
VFNCFYKAKWEHKTGFLKPHGSYRWLFESLLRSEHRFPGGLEKQFIFPCGFRTAVSTTARGFRKICENSKAFCKR